jgi:hypothetical protein
LRFYSSNNALVSPGDIVSNGYLKSLSSSGDEGGEIFLARSQANTTLDGGITIDSYQNKIRFFEQGGSARGAYIDLTQCSGGAGTNLLSGGGGTIDQYARDVNVYQNTRITAVDSFVQSSYDKANSANILAQAAFNQANTGGGSTLDQYARDTANSASSNTIIIQGVDVWQNTRMTAIEAYAQSAYSTANSGGGGGTLDQYARDVNVYQNTQITSVQTLAQAAFDQANTGGGGGGGGNNSFTTIASYGQTNIVADSLTDTLTINGGPGIAITTDPATDTITISNTGGGANTGNGTAIPVIVNTFTGNGTQNTFTLSATPGNKDQTLVIVGGVPQAKATYSLANTTLTFTEAPDNGYNIEVIIFAQSTAQGDGISAGKSIALSMIFGG